MFWKGKFITDILLIKNVNCIDATVSRPGSLLSHVIKLSFVTYIFFINILGHKIPGQNRQELFNKTAINQASGMTTCRDALFDKYENGENGFGSCCVISDRTTSLTNRNGGERSGSQPQSTYFPRDETGSVCLPTQLERTLQLY